MKRLAAALLAVGVQAPDAQADILKGPVSAILSADTIEVDGERVRLLGIDAPEPAQTCWDSGGEGWPCGRKAALALAAKIAGASIACDGMRRDREGRLIAVCRIGEENLNAWLVTNGWALAYRAQSTAFVGAEDTAREAASGLWAGAFEPPWVWRTKH